MLLAKRLLNRRFTLGGTKVYTPTLLPLSLLLANLDWSNLPQLPPLSDPKLLKAFINNTRYPGAGQAPDTTASESELLDGWQSQELSGSKIYHEILAAVLIEYKLPHTVAFMFQQALASNAFQGRISRGTWLDTLPVSPLVGGKGAASALGVRTPCSAVSGSSPSFLPDSFPDKRTVHRWLLVVGCWLTSRFISNAY
jgi:hypothetical protein